MAQGGQSLQHMLPLSPPLLLLQLQLPALLPLLLPLMLPLMLPLLPLPPVLLSVLLHCAGKQ